MKGNFKDFREFLEEVKKMDFPFKNLLLTNRIAIRLLLSEFVKSTKKPDTGRYIDYFFTKDQLKKGFEEAHRGIPVSSGNVPVMASFVKNSAFEEKIYEIKDDFF